jgi:hypothetical protein
MRRKFPKPKIFLTNDRLHIKCSGSTIGKKVGDFLYKQGYNLSDLPTNKEEFHTFLDYIFNAYGALYLEVTRIGWIYYRGIGGIFDERPPVSITGTKFLKEMKEECGSL